MERVKTDNTGIKRIKTDRVKSPVQRVKAGETPTESTPIERIKSKTERIYNGGFVKDGKTGMFLKDGEFYKLFDGCYFKAWPDGSIRDQKTDTHVCWFGKITRKLSKEVELLCSMAVQKAMIKAFPELYYDMETGERKRQLVDSEGNMIYRKIYV